MYCCLRGRHSGFLPPLQPSGVSVQASTSARTREAKSPFELCRAGFVRAILERVVQQASVLQHERRHTRRAVRWQIAPAQVVLASREFVGCHQPAKPRTRQGRGPTASADVLTSPRIQILQFLVQKVVVEPIVRPVIQMVLILFLPPGEVIVISGILQFVQFIDVAHEEHVSVDFIHQFVGVEPLIIDIERRTAAADFRISVLPRPERAGREGGAGTTPPRPRIGPARGTCGRRTRSRCAAFRPARVSDPLAAVGAHAGRGADYAPAVRTEAVGEATGPAFIPAPTEVSRGVAGEQHDYDGFHAQSSGGGESTYSPRT
jgi:hypothetical protein